MSDFMYTGKNDRKLHILLCSIANRNICIKPNVGYVWHLAIYPPQDSWRTVNEMSYFMYTYTLWQWGFHFSPCALVLKQL